MTKCPPTLELILTTENGGMHVLKTALPSLDIDAVMDALYFCLRDFRYSEESLRPWFKESE